MGKRIDGILNFLKLPEEEDFYEEEMEMEMKNRARRGAAVGEDDRPPKRFSGGSRARNAVQAKPAFSYEDEDDGYFQKGRASYADRPQTGSRIVPIRPATQGLQVCIMKPARFEDSKEVCDMLKDEHAIILNLENMDIALAQRIMDFISGAIYSLNAKIHQISGYVFCISPEKVDISGDYMDMIQKADFEVPNFGRG